MTVKQGSTKTKAKALLAGREYDAKKAPSLDQKVLIVSASKEIERSYERKQQLGLGAFAKVFMGVHKESGKEYAIKKIDRSKMVWDDRDALEDEINNLITVREGPNIVQLYEVYEERTHCYLVMELMRGGELFDRILEKKAFSEKEARESCQCILRGLAYMHERRVAHRDLKPENLLLVSKDSDTSIKLADFGFSKHVRIENGCRTLCGTPGYLAPEILERWPAYDTKCDMWSVGVIVFLLLGGYLPFEDEDDDKVFERTRNAQYFFHPEFFKSVSSEAKKFITRLLTVNPKKRAAAAAALKDEWMKVELEDTNDGKELNISKLQEKVMEEKKKKGGDDNNRLQLLKDDFTGYLERHKESDQKLVTTGKEKERATKFVEDSLTGKPFKTFYELGDVLGEGGYAVVYMATHKRTKEVYAVKDINTSVLEGNTKKGLKDEIAAMKMLRGGPHIIRLYDVFEEAHSMFMVMELCRGGDLLTRVTEKEYYTEREARKTCKILFQAMDYIHKKKVAHRDIKPENVLMVEQEDDHSIKIADFGFAKRIFKENCLRTLCGTAQYVAPEVLDLQSPGYDHRADMWSVGVVTYILLGGYAPFDGPVHELAQLIMKADYQFHDKYWGEISNEAKSMISGLLQVDPVVRLSAEQALQCPWMAMEEELLTATDLGGAQKALKEHKHDDVKIDPRNQYDQLDKSFQSSIGTLDEIMLRHTERPEEHQQTMETIIDEEREEDEDDDDDDELAEEKKVLIEDSTSGKPFETLYRWGRVMAEGNFSTLREAKHNKSNETVAVKVIRRSDLETDEAVAVQDEISTLQLLKGSEHIIKLHDVFEEPDFTYMVMERLQGGELIDRIIEKRNYTERDARVVARNVLLGIEHCHNHRVANRNIKAENIMLIHRDSLTDVKISDFGFAKRVPHPNALTTLCGTEGYIAPEILSHHPEYDVQCDMWSMGVLLYILLGGYRPFRGEGEELIRQVRYCEYKFHKRYWSSVSEDVKILISRMLTANPIGRITATVALETKWIKEQRGEEGGLDELRARARTKIKAAINSIIAMITMKANIHLDDDSA